MSHRSFRFSPPSGAPSLALRWVLRAAFADAPFDVLPAEARRLVELAEGFELDRRILHRLGEEGVAALLGAAVAHRWAASRRDVVARTLLAERLAERLASVARATGAPAVLLKGGALLLGGIAPEGVRRLADLDVLVREADEARWRAELVRRGFAVDGLAEPHHAPPLVDRELGIVELHTRLPGLAMAGGAPLDIPGLQGAGLLAPAAELRPELDGLLLPQPAFLAANVVAHALHQHTDSPAGYPGLRWVGDLLDLQEAGGDGLAGGKPAAGIEGLLRSANEALRLELSGRELAAVCAVCAALAGGVLPRPSSDGARLLTHCLAGTLDEHYRGALRLRRMARSLLRDRAHLRHRLRQRAAIAGAGAGEGRGSTAVGVARQLTRDVRSWTLVRLVRLGRRTRLLG